MKECRKGISWVASDCKEWKKRRGSKELKCSLYERKYVREFRSHQAHSECTEYDKIYLI